MIEFTIPLKTISLNKWYAGTHWTKRKKIVDANHKLVYYAIKEQNISKIKDYPIQVTIKCYFKSNRKIDVDNMATSLKFINDGMVKSGIIVDDNPKYISRVIIDTPVFGAREDKVEVTIDKHG